MTTTQTLTTFAYTTPLGATVTRRSRVKTFDYAVLMQWQEIARGGAPDYAPIGWVDKEHVGFASDEVKAEREAATVRRVCARYRNLVVTVVTTTTL